MGAVNYTPLSFIILKLILVTEYICWLKNMFSEMKTEPMGLAFFVGLHGIYYCVQPEVTNLALVICKIFYKNVQWVWHEVFEMSRGFMWFSLCMTNRLHNHKISSICFITMHKMKKQQPNKVDEIKISNKIRSFLPDISLTFYRLAFVKWR